MRLCPVCDFGEYNVLFEKELEDFDQNTSFRHLRLVICQKCGFVFNQSATQGEVEHFYAEENYYLQQESPGTGTSDKYSLMRYGYYLSILSLYLTKDAVICDVGCGKGGFVDFMRQKGYQKCFGLELQANLVSQDKMSYIKIGSMEDLPLIEEKKYDCLIIANLFEHIFFFDDVLSSIMKSLKNGGVLFIDVPNSSNYFATNREPNIWHLGTKEHINHFTQYHLNLLLNKLQESSFLLEKAEEKMLPFNKQGHFTPLLMTLFRYKKSVPNSLSIKYKKAFLSNQIKYINESNALIEKTNNIINNFVESQKPIICWGIGYTFFMFASTTKLLDCNIAMFIDKNVDKQAMTYHGSSIVSPETISDKLTDYDVFLFSNQFADEIKFYLASINHKGDVVVL